MGSSSSIFGVKIKNIWNRHPPRHSVILYLRFVWCLVLVLFFSGVQQKYRSPQVARWPVARDSWQFWILRKPRFHDMKSSWKKTHKKCPDRFQTMPFVKNTILLGGHRFFSIPPCHKQLGRNLKFESLLFLLFFTLLHLILPLIGSLRLLNPCLHKRSTKAYPPPLNSLTWGIAGKSPHFPIGNTSTHFGSTFQPAMLVFRTLRFFAKVPCKGTFAEGDFIWTNHQFSGEYKLVFNGCKKKLYFIATSPGFESNRDTAEKRDFGRCLFLLFDLFFFLLLLLLCLLLPDLAHFFSAWRLQSLKS